MIRWILSLLLKYSLKCSGWLAEEPECSYEFRATSEYAGVTPQRFVFRDEISVHRHRERLTKLKIVPPRGFGDIECQIERS